MGFFSGFGIGDLISGAIGVAGLKSQDSLNTQSQNNFDRNLAFQKEAAKNAHQWEVADLKKAGLNPILSGTGGAGAKPAGGSQLPKFDNKITSAMQASRLRAETRKLNADEIKTQQDTSTSKSAEELNRSLSHLRNQEARVAERQADLTSAKSVHEDVKIDETQSKIILNKLNSLNIHGRNKVLKESLKISEQQFKQMLTKWPGLLTEQKIDQSLFGQIIRWAGRLNPFGSSAKDINAIVNPSKGIIINK